MQDPYRILGVSRQATDEEIKRAYFALVRKHTPERDPEKFKQIRSAYDRIKSRRARAENFLLSFEETECSFKDVEPKPLELALDFSIVLLGDDRFSQLSRIEKGIEVNR